MVNGSDRQSMVSSGMISPVSGGGGGGVRDSVMSELESPATPRRGGFGSQMQPPPTIAEQQPYELAGREEG